ncbi:EamA family transporter [Chitinophaga cymbidii]|uniref:Drug/metabolite exporter YedA n=1 Tax=Chitinophaga cymbidii TaxID=1096750 RepID=A0A512RSD6_9BACT|nr:EamA family transporter [Chitinophaga cymbidii]GEP98610.1 drug/metabolite exporter YedA [Chitinophaga cymbidii]
MNIPHKTKLVTALGLVYILWGSTYLGMKIATEILPPFLLSAIRFVIAGSIMFGIGLRVEKEMPTGRQWLNAAFIGVMLIGIGNSSVALAVRYMPSGLVALFIAALPAWFIALDWAFFSKERPKALTLWGLFLGFAGLCFIFNPLDTSHRDYPLWPIPILTFGSVAWALGSLLSPRLNTPKQLTSSGIQMLAGVVSSVILSTLLERQEWGALEAATLRTWSAVLYLVIFGSLIGYTAYSWLVNNAPARLASTYAYVNPVVAILLGWLVVDETLSGRALTGSAIVIAGVVLMTWKKK